MPGQRDEFNRQIFEQKQPDILRVENNSFLVWRRLWVWSSAGEKKRTQQQKLTTNKQEPDMVPQTFCPHDFERKMLAGLREFQASLSYVAN